MLAAAALSACSTTAPGASSSGGSGVITVVAAENFWGSLAQQLGGSHVKVTSIINNPDSDPHDYEPTAADGRDIAGAKLAIVNGVGYDAWATKLAEANPSSSRTTLTVGDLVGAKDGDNPHRWYNPDNVRQVIDQITADYKKIDPADASFFTTQHDTVINQNLKAYFDAIASIKATYSGTPVGASESIFAMLSPALGLNLLTPPAFLTDISEGGDPSAQDKATIDHQIKSKQIKLYVYNSQNATPDVQAQVNEAKAAGIPVSTITETLTPAGASFQDWQVAQLNALRQALAQASAS
ncbi:ABC transporter substrate-binding protein [Rugosimonospora africana]|uniref:ABC transporter substrate-binding protein n=1 Tax=Rugosimonospora africana TaxID=556532 RepID=A0A8J3R2R9_9ACTN|nr:ABC transporter substrate-binding protein [Rugosimonospora africana]